MKAWTEQEDKLLLAAYQNRTPYAIIATEYLPHRSEKSLKKRMSRLREVGAGTNNRGLPAPADFNLAANMLNRIAADHWNVTEEIISRWRRETGIRSLATNGVTRKPVPHSFRATAPTMTRTELAEHYGVGKTTIERFVKETGAQPLIRRAPIARSIKRLGHPDRVIRDNRAQTEADKAARFLQRFGRIYRCDENGEANLNGTHWNRNGFVLTDADVIERAAWLAERRAA